MHQIINQLQQLQQQIAQVTQNLQGMQNQLQTITGQVQSQNAEMKQQEGLQNARTNPSYGSQFLDRQAGYASFNSQTQGQSNRAQFNPTQMNQAGQSSGIASPVSSSGINQSTIQSVMNADQGARTSNTPGRQSEYSSYGRNFQ